jgi:hypothetical protein
MGDPRLGRQRCSTVLGAKTGLSEGPFGCRERRFLAPVTLPWQPRDVALTPAQKQQRYRDKLKVRSQASPETVEAALLAEVERAKRGELSREEGIALADKLTDLANRYLWRAHELSKTAMKVRAGH